MPLEATTTLTREAVHAAVDEYGEAWKTHDAERIARLFSEDAVYVERPYERKATYRGRREIHAYWTKQVIGKQSDVRFFNARDDVVLDAERRRAVVKWFASFDNCSSVVRAPSSPPRSGPPSGAGAAASVEVSAGKGRDEDAGKDGEKETGKEEEAYARKEDAVVVTTPTRVTTKVKKERVRFVQVAMLHFDDEGKIAYLEEYWHSEDKQGCRLWPDDDATQATRRATIRMEPGAFEGKGSKTAACERCGVAFPSRSKLFGHLRRSGGCDAAAGRRAAAPNAADNAPSGAIGGDGSEELNGGGGGGGGGGPSDGKQRGHGGQQQQPRAAAAASAAAAAATADETETETAGAFQARVRRAQPRSMCVLDLTPKNAALYPYGPGWGSVASWNSFDPWIESHAQFHIVKKE